MNVTLFEFPLDAGFSNVVIIDYYYVNDFSPLFFIFIIGICLMSCKYQYPRPVEQNYDTAPLKV